LVDAEEGGAGEVVHLAQPDLECPPRRVAGNARTVDPAAHYEQVERRSPLPFMTQVYSALDRKMQGPQMAAWAFAQDHPVRRRRLRRVEDLLPLEGLFDKFVGKPDEPARPRRRPPPSEPLSARKSAIQETVQCAGCGAYIPARCRKMRPVRPSPATSPVIGPQPN
jgi:hypothetical protein